MEKKTRILAFFSTATWLFLVLTVTVTAQSNPPHTVVPPPNAQPCVPHLLPVPVPPLTPNEEADHDFYKSLLEVGICSCENCHIRISDQAAKGIKEALRKNPKAMATYKHPTIVNTNSENLTARYKRAQAQFAKLDDAQQLEIQNQINALGSPKDLKNLEALLDKLGSGFFKPRRISKSPR